MSTDPWAVAGRVYEALNQCGERSAGMKANDVRALLAESRSAQIPLRIRSSLRDQLIARAEANGRSLTVEIEMLIERALRDDDVVAGRG